MKALFIQYPKCTTCKRALKFLQEKGVLVETRNIVEDTPTVEELRSLIMKSGLPFKKFFNTSGLVYKELELKDRIKDMTFEEALTLLASNGMLIKRPLLITDQDVLVGFKEEAYEAIFK